MYKCKIFISITIFTIFLVGTSMIKNQTRNLEKKIYNLSKIIYFHEENLKESQLDFFYHSSPIILEQKVEYVDHIKYAPMDQSKIFLNFETFNKLKNKYVNHER